MERERKKRSIFSFNDGRVLDHCRFRDVSRPWLLASGFGSWLLRLLAPGSWAPGSFKLLAPGSLCRIMMREATAIDHLAPTVQRILIVVIGVNRVLGVIYKE
jgi:hypothetical protein